jgi:hypothetical protein
MHLNNMMGWSGDKIKKQILKHEARQNFSVMQTDNESESEEFNFQKELDALKERALTKSSTNQAQQPPENNPAALSERVVSVPDWLEDVVGRSEFAVVDFQDFFLLVQVLSVIWPDAVDLSWYMTDGALNCPDLTGKS